MPRPLHHPPSATSRSFITMINEWRISKTTIEAEMMRLASLLSIPSKLATAPAGLARCEARAANTSLRNALRAVAASR
jgi:hypothetical protein